MADRDVAIDPGTANTRILTRAIGCAAAAISMRWLRKLSKVVTHAVDNKWPLNCFSREVQLRDEDSYSIRRF